MVFWFVEVMNCLWLLVVHTQPGFADSGAGLPG